MELKIEYLPVKALKPYEKNTRKHQKIDVDNIARSIEKYGMNDAIGIWGEENIIVEGHGRLMACKKLGMKEVPCVRLDHLTDEQRREYASLIMQRLSCPRGILIFCPWSWTIWI